MDVRKFRQTRRADQSQALALSDARPGVYRDAALLQMAVLGDDSVSVLDDDAVAALLAT
jgi:hypothetical protein